MQCNLDHYSIRTTQLDATVGFYCDLLGLRNGERPPFKFPGAWLYNDRQALVHIIGIDPNDPSGLIEYLGDKDPSTLVGGGAFDHVAFAMTDLPALYARIRARGTPFRERTVPDLNLHQVFLEDPNGVTLELNFTAEDKARADRATAAVPA